MQTIKNLSLHRKTYALSLTVFIFILIVGFITLGTDPEARLKLCWLFKGRDGPVLASYPSPDGFFIIHAIQPVCGQSSYWGKIYDCSTRLDLEITDGRIIKGADLGGECNVSIKWLNNSEFEVKTQSDTKIVTNIADSFGILP